MNITVLNFGLDDTSTFEDIYPRAYLELLCTLLGSTTIDMTAEFLKDSVDYTDGDIFDLPADVFPLIELDGLSIGNTQIDYVALCTFNGTHFVAERENSVFIFYKGVVV